MRINIKKLDYDAVGQAMEVSIIEPAANDGMVSAIFKTNHAIHLVIGGQPIHINCDTDGHLVADETSFREAMYEAFLHGVTTTSYANGANVPSAQGAQQVFDKFWKEWAGE